MTARVLVLEDDVALAREIQRAFLDLGCSVEVIRDGNAGLARATTERFDLVVASLELPGMNGFRLCNRLKKEPAAAGVPIFLVSNQPQDVFDEHRKLPTRAQSYFNKPLTLAELVARARVMVPGLALPSDGGPPSSSGPVAPKVGKSSEEAGILDDLVVTDAEAEALPSAKGRVEKVDVAVVDALRKQLADKDETHARLKRELAEVRRKQDAAAPNDLSKQLAEKEESNVRLSRELAEARKLAEEESSPKPEVVTHLER